MRTGCTKVGGGNCHLWLYSYAPLKPGNTLDMALEVYGERQTAWSFIYSNICQSAVAMPTDVSSVGEPDFPRFCS